jgi:hypothetical protein
MLEHVAAIAVELARSRVQRDRDVLARPVSRGLDARQEHRQSLLVGAQVRREAALVPHGRSEPSLVQRALERMEHLRTHSQAFRERLGAAGDDHELLEVDLVVGVGTAVEHVHHRNRQHPSRLAAEVAPQRESLLGGLRMRRGGRHAEDRVGAEPGLVGGPVERDQSAVQRRLVGGVHARQRCGDLAVHIGHRAHHALALPALAAVAQLRRLELARRRSRRHGGVAVGTGAQPYLDLDGRVAAAVEDLAGVDSLDLTHAASLPVTDPAV